MTEVTQTRARRGWGVALLSAGTVVALVIGAGYAAAARRPEKAAARDAVPAVFFDWPARGSLRDDAAVVAAARDEWDHKRVPKGDTPPPPHTDVGLLYAERLEHGDLVVFQGRDGTGLPRLGVVFLPRQVAESWIPPGVLTAPLPSPLTARHLDFGLLDDDAATGPIYVVIGEPGVTTVARSDPAAPDTFLPMPVHEGVAVAAAGPEGVAKVLVANAGGTIYQGWNSRTWGDAPSRGAG
ncbi:MAG TPA: hypothetical protein VFQ85_07710 [Mycobacteriales bacterium]|nr:hypothetical protein [Mycobacteriales bacterium]